MKGDLFFAFARRMRGRMFLASAMTLMPLSLPGQTTYTSTGSGSWSAMTWSPVGIPGASDNVVIRDADAVMLDASIVLTHLTIGEGTSGSLTFDATARTVALSGNLTVRAGATFITQASGAATHTMSIAGDLTNNGTFDMSRGGSTLICNVTFNKPGDQTVSGSGTLTRFRAITLMKGAAINRVVASTNVSMGGASAVVFTAGTWEQVSGTLAITSASQTLAAGGALVLSGSGSLNMQIAGSWAVQGTLTVNTSGSFITGSGNNNVTPAATGVINFLAGTVTIYGRLTLSAGTTTINGANIFIDPRSSSELGQTSNPFEISGSGSLNFQSGSITFVDPLAAPTTGCDIRILSTTGSVNLSGGTFIFGNGTSTTTGAAGFRISNVATPVVPLGNIIVQTGGIAGRDLSLQSGVEVNGTITLSSGIFSLGSFPLTLGEQSTTTGASASSFIATTSTGVLTKRLGGDATFTFPIGDAVGTPEFSPMTATLSGGVYSSAALSVSATNAKHGNNTSATDFLNRYWSVTQSGISGATYAMTFTYVDGDISGSEAGLILGRWNGTSWTDLGAGIPSSNSLSALTTELGDFTGAEPGALPIQLASFTGRIVDGNNVRLDWTTISEINNYGFFVQRRGASDREFAELEGSFIPGHGTTLEPQTYAYTDEGVADGRWYYRLRQIDLDGSVFFTDPIHVDIVTSVAEDIPRVFSLNQNYPNPFNPSTSITFTVEKNGFSSITIFNILGQEVMRPFAGMAEAGRVHTVRFDGTVLPTGLYFYKLSSGERTDLKRMLLIK